MKDTDQEENADPGKNRICRRERLKIKQKSVTLYEKAA